MEIKNIKPGTVYIVDAPEKVGVMPIRTDICIEKSEENIGWKVEEKNYPIYIDENNEILSVENFKPGIKVRVQTLIGVFRMTTGEISGNKFAETETLIAPLEEDNGFLVSFLAISKSVLKNGVFIK